MRTANAIEDVPELSGRTVVDLGCRAWRIATAHRLVLFVLLITGALLVCVPGHASAHVPGSDASVSISEAADGSCEAQGLISVGIAGLCTHGPDPLPPTATGAPVGPVFSTSADEQKAVCDGDGVSGSRIQVLYVRPVDKPDRFPAFEASIRTWAHDADMVFRNNAAAQGGERYLRFVHAPDCTISVLPVVIGSIRYSPTQELIYDLNSQGINNPQRHYLIYYDTVAPGVCGQGTIKGDDSPGPGNLNNTTTSYAIMFNTCWGYSEGSSHEIMHTLGAVQSSAPHPSAFGHCTDGWEIMCYADANGVTMTYPCAIENAKTLLDCGGDDYFNLNPPLASYLDTHWNTADSAFLGPRASLELDKTSSKYNGLVNLTLSRFEAFSMVSITFDGTLLTSVMTDGSGGATLPIRTPLAVFGPHQLVATDEVGTSASATLRVIPRILLNETSGTSGAKIRVYLYGFASGETVEIRWQTAPSTFSVLGSTTIAENGRGTKLVTIPANAVAGPYTIVGKVVGVSRSASTPFTVTGPGSSEDPTETPTPTGTPTSTGTPETTGTPVLTETPEATPTEMATETATVEPTVTETPVPTETVQPEPTATETAIIEPTAIAEPTETPIPPTPEPAPTEVVAIRPEIRWGRALQPSARWARQ